MKTSRKFTAAIAAVSLVGVSACVTDPNTGEQKISRAAIGGVLGAGGGALLGGLIGGRTARIAGAVAGGALGGYAGYRMDNQIRELKDQTAGSGIDVNEVDGGQAILVNLPEGVTFTTGSYQINSGFQTLLDRVAASLQQYPNSLVDVYGYTDTVGSATSNQRLSEQRAQAVANYLISRGVSSSRIRWLGFGETNLKVQTGDNVNEPANRRVEVKIIPISQAEANAAN
ncbi:MULTISPECIES: OmpA family protein [Bacteria]|uniref:OmpA family protein n=1 Tax=Bacteria TaxID=2 RepID=UPI00103E827B|nr:MULTISPECIES: OmpA family protein [Bacteria]QDM41179.1 OmpA family protein [Altererythrobacter sp. TH136]TCJ41197.1 OmpA family protein [Parafrankia sp. BMG5.11]